MGRWMAGVFAAFALVSAQGGVVRTGAPEDVAALCPAFPTHWTQSGIYSAWTQEVYGRLTEPGCVAVAGAATMQALRWPEAFGEKSVIMDKPRDLRAGPMDWAALSPAPNRPEGVTEVQALLYNLGLLTEMGYGTGGSASRTPIINLGGALVDAVTGYASAYKVELPLDATTQTQLEGVIWASLRCGSPVPLSLQLGAPGAGYGAHAVVACGYGYDAEGKEKTAVFFGYGSDASWVSLPRFSVLGNDSVVDNAIAGVVARRPEGVEPGAYAFPIVGNVEDAEGRPIPYAEVTLARNGRDIASVRTDHRGRYGLWGWFGGAHTVRCGDASQTFAAQESLVTFSGSRPVVSANALCAAVGRHTATLRPGNVAAFELCGSWAAAQAQAQASGKNVLCLLPTTDAQRADIRAMAETGALADYVLWAAHPETVQQVGKMSTRPTASAVLLLPGGQMAAYCLGEPLRDFLNNGFPRSTPAVRLERDAVLSEIGLAPGNDLTLAAGVTLTLDGTLTVGTLTTEGAAALVAPSAGPRLNLSALALGGALTVDGPRLDLAPGAPLGGDVALRNGAHLRLAAGRLGTAGLSAEDAAVDLLGANTLMADAAFAGACVLSAEGKNAALTLSGARTFTLVPGAGLSCAVPLADAGEASLTVAGGAAGDAAAHVTFGEVRLPVRFRGAAVPEGGPLKQGATFAEGAGLNAGRLLSVQGRVSAEGTLPVFGRKVGVFLVAGNALEPSAFRTEAGFAVERTLREDNLYAYRLVSEGSTPPALYVGGAQTDASAFDPSASARNLLLFVPREHKELGYWDAFARWKSSAEGGGWNVLLASRANVPAGEAAAAWVAATPARYVLLGAEASAMPEVTPAEGQCVGRLPIRATMTFADVSVDNYGPVIPIVRDAEAQIADYLAKAQRHGTGWQPDALTLVGDVFAEAPSPYTVPEIPFERYDGLPALSSGGYYGPPRHATFALRERYRRFCEEVPALQASPKLSFYVDGSTYVNVPSCRDLGATEGAVMWLEGQSEAARLTAFYRYAEGATAKPNRIYDGAVKGLHTLMVAPASEAGKGGADGPRIGETLVLAPHGGALALVGPTEAYTPLITAEGLVDEANSPIHAACQRLMGRIMRTPGLTIGEALATEGMEGLALIGDPTVRVAPFSRLGFRLRMR